MTNMVTNDPRNANPIDDPGHSDAVGPAERRAFIDQQIFLRYPDAARKIARETQICRHSDPDGLDALILMDQVVDLLADDLVKYTVHSDGTHVCGGPDGFKTHVTVRLSLWLGDSPLRPVHEYAEQE